MLGGDKMNEIANEITTSAQLIIKTLTEDGIKIVSANDIFDFVKTIFATGLGAWLGIKLTMHSNIKLEQEKLKITMINEMYRSIKKDMVRATVWIQVARKSIDGSIVPLVNSDEQMENIDEALKKVDILLNSIKLYKFETLIFYKKIDWLSNMYARLKNRRSELCSQDHMNELFELLGETNTCIMRFEQELFNYYLEETGFKKSKQYKKYNKLVEQDIEFNIDVIKNSSKPFGVMIKEMEDNGEL